MSKGMEDTALNGVVADNMDKDFVQRIANQNPDVSNAMPTEDGRMTHYMANGDGRVFPTVINDNGVMRQLNRGERPPESIDMGNDMIAEWFGRNYKRTNPQGFSR